MDWSEILRSKSFGCTYYNYMQFFVSGFCIFFTNICTVFHKNLHGIFETFFTVFFSECVFTFWVIGFPLLVKVLLVKSFCKASRGRIYAFAQNVISKKHFRDCLSNLFSNVFQIIVKMWYQRNFRDCLSNLFSNVFQMIVKMWYQRNISEIAFQI